ncbi:MAG: nucleotidyltransferase family protein [Pyrinomonadaceae bacterium]
MSESAIGIIVLAAGASSRMGEPKQLLRYEGETLLGRAVRAALETRCRPVVVVLGACADALRAEVDATGALVVVNQAWAEGMSSSIRLGLSALGTSTSGELDAAVLLLCDQPFVTSGIIMQLIDAYLERRPMLIASEYEVGGERTRGVPALFSRALFPELMKLRGAEGAKRIITRHESDAAFIAVPAAAFDVDTPDDYQDLQNNSLHNRAPG